jgi:peptide chain release factor 2
MAQPGFFSDARKLRESSSERAQAVASIEKDEAYGERMEETETLLELLEEGEDCEPQVQEAATALNSALERDEAEMLMSGQHDRADAIFTLHPGAGGVDAQDWAEMLLRMYLRWCEKRGLDARVVDRQPGDEAGIKSATVRVSGPYAYGLLKTETGVHRLIRMSPFDQQGRRHTAFASFHAYPDVAEDIEIEIADKDLKVDTYRSSGAGGQHVNVTDSAIRITHLPTGIVVTCQNERSQIRSYFMHPSQRVKDHRTDVEVGQVGPVLDGDIDVFIQAYLTAPRERPQDGEARP